MPLIVFEGIDGCGKSTQLARVHVALDEVGIPYRSLREPGGTALGERQRALLLDPATEAGPQAELFGYLQARAQLCAEVVAPALAAGELILLDRFYHSTLAYQGYGLGMPMNQVRAAIDLAIGPIRPDRVLWFDCPPETAVSRRRAAGDQDRIEQRGLDYMTRVHEGYRLMSAAGELLRIDADRDADAVFADVWAAVQPLARPSGASPQN